MDYCQWGEKKDDRIYRCVSKAVESVRIGGEQVFFCPSHLSIVRRMLKRKVDYEFQLGIVDEELRKVLEAMKELETAVQNKAGQDITCKYCHTVFQHDGTLNPQVCTKCGKELIV